MEFLSVVAAFTAVGVFVDFVIGKSGQKKVRAWLEEKWLIWSDIKLDNFGRREAAFATNVIDRIFGRFFSFRRAACLALVFFGGVFYTIFVPIIRFGFADYFTNGQQELFLILGSISVTSILFTVNVSITRFFSTFTSAKLPASKISSFMYVLVVLIAQYLFSLVSLSVNEAFLMIISVMSTWQVVEVPYDPLYQVIDSFRDAAVGAIEYWSWMPYDDNDIWFDFGYDGFSAANIYAGVLSALLNLGRLFVLILFLLSFLLKPAQNAILTLWARIVESDKPIFTLVMSGVGAAIKIVQELSKAILAP